jgi:hypothetical protein
MKTLYASVASAALAVLSAGAVAAESSVPPQKDVSIPFANRGGIRDWQADRDRGVWIQDVHNKWYYAKFMGPCLGLNFANSIAFDTRPMGNFDRFSAVIVPRNGRCTVQSLTMSGPPPSHKSKQANAEAPLPKG